MSGEATGVLAQFATSLRYEDLPTQVKDHCKNVLLDTLACAVAGHLGEETPQIAALASALGQSEESSIIGGRPPPPARPATLHRALITSATVGDAPRSPSTPRPPPGRPPCLRPP